MTGMIVFLWLVVGVHCVMATELPLPPGIKYLGMSYDILKGNPDGDPNLGNMDPGLLATRRLYGYSFSEERLSVERKYRLPDQVVYSGERDTQYTGKSKSVFIGEKSYQSKLSQEITAEGSGSYGLASFSFSLSHRSSEMRTGSSLAKNVFIDEKTIQSYGSLRLRYAESPLRNEYRRKVCKLPRIYTNWKTSGENSQGTRSYMRFFDSWGTHFVTQVQLGEKLLHRYKSSAKTFTTSLMTQRDNSVTAGGSYGEYSGSLSVKLSKVNENDLKTSSDDEVSETIKLGSKSHPEPIHLVLLPKYRSIVPENVEEPQNSSMKIKDAPENAVHVNSYNGTEDEILLENADYITVQNCPNWEQIRMNLKKAMLDYPLYKGAKKPDDPELRIPLTWPKGRYGLPKPASGCPAESNWNGGWRKYDTEDDDTSNSWSSPNHFAASLGGNIENRYCIKPTASKDDMPWSPGSYCVYMFDNKCPEGFEKGSIYWDDEDDSNSNSWGGMVPSGEYGSNTKIQYCCRSDGSAFSPIYLPTESNFYLLMGPTSSYCQKVNGMRESEEWIEWDTEDDDNKNSRDGTYPKSDVGRNVKIYYCYYTKA